MMNHCNTCQYLLPEKTDMNDDRNYIYQLSPPMCNYFPHWEVIISPEKHYCAQWQEKEE